MSERFLANVSVFGTLLFVSLIIIINPAVAWPICVVFASVLCYTMVKDEFVIAREMRKIDREHEAL